MAGFALPLWQKDSSFELEARLSHRFHGAFMLPTHNHPKARRDFADSKIELVSCTWRVDVVEAPEQADDAGPIELNLVCIGPEANPFEGLAYRMKLLRHKDAEEGALAVRLHSVHGWFPPAPASSEEEPQPQGRLGALLLEPDSELPCFEPSRELGFCFDFPLLSAAAAPGEPEEHERAGLLHRYRVEAADGGLRWVWSCLHPGGPRLRTRIHWLPGQPWYRELVCERVYDNDDATEEIQLVASIQLR